MSLQSNVVILVEKLKDLEDVLCNVNKVLEIPDDIEHKVINLETDIQTLQKLLRLISLIPAIKTPIISLEKVVQPVYDMVESIKSNISLLDNNYVNPIRLKIQEFILRIQRAESSLLLVKDVPNEEHINFLVKELIKAISIVEKPLMEVGSNGVVKMLGEFDKALKDVNFIDNMFRPVEKVLDEKITIPYSFKVKVKVPKTKKIKSWTTFWNFVWKEVTVWEWDWQIKTQYFTFTVNQILSGVDAIQKVIDLLKEKVDELLDPILKILHFDIQIPGLPSLDNLTQEIQKLISINIKPLDNIESSIENIFALSNTTPLNPN